MRPRRAFLTLALLGSIAAAAGCGQGEFHATFGQAGPDGDAGEAGVPADAGPGASDVGDDADVALPPSGLAHGSACKIDDECAGGRCLQGGTWTDGYCTEPCGLDCTGGDGAKCIRPELSTINICAAKCSAHSDCRTGYVCKTDGFSDHTVCLPGERGNPDGEPCEADEDCGGGSCITDWPGGYCTTARCATFEDCDRGADGALNNRCLRNPSGADLCVRVCQTSEECRDGYLCEPLGPDQGFCAPDPSRPFNPAAFENLPFEIVCVPTVDGAAQLDFEIGAATTSYMITPLTMNGGGLEPRSITLPGGSSIDFGGANWFQTIAVKLYGGGMNPTIVPATAQLTAQLEAGTHAYLIDSEAAETCYYVLEESEAGTTIDFNVYFVGVTGASASTAPSNPDLQILFDTVDLIFDPVGVGIGQIRYFDIVGPDAEALSILRNEGDVADLVTLSQRPGDTYDEVLSVNIFFVRSFAMDGAIGISMGLPGPAGLHGTHGSGVAFTSEYLGQQVDQGPGSGAVDGNVLTAQVLAHELGHYLGLFHTSEANGATHDPLPDTPECQQIGPSCPDVNNLMFPYAGTGHTTVTVDQGFVLGVNPLTKVPGGSVVEPEPDAGYMSPDAGQTNPDAGGTP